MFPERIEHAQAQEIIAGAWQVRRSLANAAALDSRCQTIPPQLLKSFDQLLGLAECLLAERKQYESRLHRSHLIEPAAGLPAQQAQ